MSTFTTITFYVLLILCLTLAIFTVVLLIVGVYKDEKQHDEYICRSQEQLQQYANEILNRK